MKAYIAGPDLFYPNGKELAVEARELATKYGFQPLHPLDSDYSNVSPDQLSLAIFKTNVKLIEEADVVIANISPFRGPSADAGTVWEIGCAYAQGKKVFAFTNDLRNYRTRVGYDTDPDGNDVESLDLVENLMVAHAIVSTHATIEEAFAAAAAAKDTK